jgi:ABC-type sugar transport system ATPase subunit
VLQLIRDVRDRGLPVILISHNMPHVFEIAAASTSSGWAGGPP